MLNIDSVIPVPNACAECGQEQKSHGYTVGKRGLKSHYYIEPSNAHRLERMKARRALRLLNK